MSCISLISIVQLFISSYLFLNFTFIFTYAVLDYRSSLNSPNHQFHPCISPIVSRSCAHHVTSVLLLSMRFFQLLNIQNFYSDFWVIYLMLMFVDYLPLVYPYSRILSNSYLLSETRPDVVNCPKEETPIFWLFLCLHPGQPGGIQSSYTPECQLLLWCKDWWMSAEWAACPSQPSLSRHPPIRGLSLPQWTSHWCISPTIAKFQWTLSMPETWKLTI
jgi:hypothetical protein